MLNKDSVVENVEAVGVKIKSIKRLEREDVYCLGSKKNGTMIANGIIVSNCDALRYVLFSHFFDQTKDDSTPQELEKRFREARGMSPDLPSFFRHPPM